jgi:azurin
VIAHTPMAKPGETTEVTFTAPAAGTYPFICTVPGHYMLMKGVFTAAPQGAPSM